jgi:hypothetical protein
MFIYTVSVHKSDLAFPPRTVNMFLHYQKNPFKSIKSISYNVSYLYSILRGHNNSFSENCNVISSSVKTGSDNSIGNEKHCVDVAVLYDTTSRIGVLLD